MNENHRTILALLLLIVFYLSCFLGVAVAPQGGQADYSAQWIEYYRSMGMTREAEAIEQQARVRDIF